MKLHDSTRPLTEKCESLIHHSYPPAPIDVRLMNSPNACFSQYYSFNNKTMPGLIHHENKTCAKYCFCSPSISKRLHFFTLFLKCTWTVVLMLSVILILLLPLRVLEKKENHSFCFVLLENMFETPRNYISFSKF